MKPEFTGRRLRHFRKIRRWSIQELSKASGVSERLIEKIEEAIAERTHPLILQKLADALLIDLQDLLEESDPPEPPAPMPATLGWIADRVADILAALVFVGAMLTIAGTIFLAWTLVE